MERQSRSSSVFMLDWTEISFLELNFQVSVPCNEQMETEDKERKENPCVTGQEVGDGEQLAMSNKQ